MSVQTDSDWYTEYPCWSFDLTVQWVTSQMCFPHYGGKVQAVLLKCGYLNPLSAVLCSVSPGCHATLLPPAGEISSAELASKKFEPQWCFHMCNDGHCVALLLEGSSLSWDLRHFFFFLDLGMIVSICVTNIGLFLLQFYLYSAVCQICLMEYGIFPSPRGLPLCLSVYQQSMCLLACKEGTAHTFIQFKPRRGLFEDHEKIFILNVWNPVYTWNFKPMIASQQLPHHLWKPQ